MARQNGARFVDTVEAADPLRRLLQILLGKVLCRRFRWYARQDSFMLRTKRSAWLFSFGDRGGSFTDFVPASRSTGTRYCGGEWRNVRAI
jgi:hypothetical protein